MIPDGAVWATTPEVVGTKFHADGRVRHFPGNTLITFVEEDSPLGRCASTATALLRDRLNSHKFAYLPATSWHLTICQLVCDQVRDAHRWSSKLPNDTPLVDVDAFMSDAVSLVAPINTPLLMAFRNMTAREVLSIELAPANARTADVLARYRDDVVHHTGVRHPDHDDYVFHISLAYRIASLSPTEVHALNRVLQLAAQTLATAGPFEVEPPQLTFFDDMFEFRPDRR